ncbi:serum response factor-like isoform X4 [Alosa pseudoharengus]|uniref:serum response factor-like isoform X4 n=1 Tax=Alosa pseudoharengus TaxID=34774 RepID=UPI003F8B14A9
MITSETGKALIQTCLNSPDSPAPRAPNDPSSEQRMSATGFEETELSYQVAEGGEDGKAVFTLSSLQSAAPSSTSTPPSSSSSSSSPPPPPLPSSTSAITSSSSTAPCWSVGANGTVLKSTGTPAHGNATSAGVVLPPGFTIMSGAGLPQQLQLQVQASSHQGGTISSSSDSTSTSDINHITVSSSASHPTTIITSSSSSSSVAATGHMMYSSPHAVMYATPTHAEGGGGLTVLNPFPPHSHSQAQDTGGVPQMFFTGPQGTVHAVPLHSMLIGQQQPGGGGSSNLTELRVVSLDSGKAD